MPPAEFLPIAERAGLIGELLRWALRGRDRRAPPPLPDGEQPLRIGVNVPVRLPRDRHAGRRRAAGAAALGPGARAAGPARSTRRPSLSDDERVGLDVASAAAHGRARGPRRLRQRRVGAGPPDPAADRHPQAGPFADHPASTATRRAARSASRSSASARALGPRRRGRRAWRPPAQLAALVRLRVRLRPGLPDLPPDAAGRRCSPRCRPVPARCGPGWSGSR